MSTNWSKLQLTQAQRMAKDIKKKRIVDFGQLWEAAIQARIEMESATDSAHQLQQADEGYRNLRRGRAEFALTPVVYDERSKSYLGGAWPLARIERLVSTTRCGHLSLNEYVSISPYSTYDCHNSNNRKGWWIAVSGPTDVTLARCDELFKEILSLKKEATADIKDKIGEIEYLIYSRALTLRGNASIGEIIRTVLRLCSGQDPDLQQRRRDLIALLCKDYDDYKAELGGCVVNGTASSGPPQMGKPSEDMANGGTEEPSRGPSVASMVGQSKCCCFLQCIGPAVRRLCRQPPKGIR